MSDTPDNLVLAMLREMRADIGTLKRRLDELHHLTSTVRDTQLSMRREAVADAMSAASTSDRVHELAERVDRIERRLELRD